MSYVNATGEKFKFETGWLYCLRDFPIRVYFLFHLQLQVFQF